MQIPIQITMRDIPHSDAVEMKIKEKSQKLEQYSDAIISCHATVEMVTAKPHQGKLYNLRLIVSMPSKKELVITRNTQDDLYKAIRDAFNDMVRKIETTTQKWDGAIKNHSEILTGKIARLFEGEDPFGFIETMTGDEYYFTSDNLVHPKKFDRLHAGMEVHFIERIGQEGPRACRVSAKGHAS